MDLALGIKNGAADPHPAQRDRGNPRRGRNLTGISRMTGRPRACSAAAAAPAAKAEHRDPQGPTAASDRAGIIPSTNAKTSERSPSKTSNRPQELL
jgi:hypothetical protein